MWNPPPYIAIEPSCCIREEEEGGGKVVGGAFSGDHLPVSGVCSCRRRRDPLTPHTQPPPPGSLFSLNAGTSNSRLKLQVCSYHLRRRRSSVGRRRKEIVKWRQLLTISVANFLPLFFSLLSRCRAARVVVDSEQHMVICISSN